MRRVVLSLAAAAGLALGIAPHAADAAVTGEQRVLLVLVTWGPEPYAAEHASSSLAEAARYVRSTSFGRTWIAGTSTPWLRALPSPLQQCDLALVERLARGAATRAGFDPARYARLALGFPEIPCPWGGAYFNDVVWANGYLGWQLIAHELGHLYGTPEEGPAWACDGGRCEPRNYQSPYSVMGHGSTDYSVYEKVVYGWIDDVVRPRSESTISLGAIDRPLAAPQAVHVLVAGDEYWLEYRPPAPLFPYDQPDATPGVVIYGGDSGVDDAPSRFTQRNLLLLDPAGRGRPSVQAGETFAVTGAFAVSVTRTDSERAALAFRWTDTTAPAGPRVVAPASTVRSRRALVRWRPARDRGSGVGAYEVSVDGRRPRTVPAVATLGALVVANEPELELGRLAPGAHRVAVVAVDRAGNRSPPAIRRFRVVA